VRRFLFICFGGAVGTGARYLVTLGAQRLWGKTFPAGTLIVNVAGCFLLGILMHLAAKNVITDDSRLVLGTGVMGGLTTYSTFNYETLQYLQDGAWAMGGLDFFATTFLCLLAGMSGLALARWYTGV
jgi:CrcB protein